MQLAAFCDTGCVIFPSLACNAESHVCITFGAMGPFCNLYELHAKSIVFLKEIDDLERVRWFWV